jgi:hypothetical protein
MTINVTIPELFVLLLAGAAICASGFIGLRKTKGA